MQKVKKLDIIEHYKNEFGYEILYGEEIYDKDGEIEISFEAYDLAPEDACLGRGIFDCGNYIDALNMGIKLAKAGYDKVEIGEAKKGEE